MKILTLILSFFMLNQVLADNFKSSISSFTVKPNDIDKNYDLKNKDHYVVTNSKSKQNKLVLFFGGSFSTPKNYNLVCDHAANLGFDVISLSYKNEVAAADVAKIADDLIFDKYREEICFGTQTSEQVVVDSLNSIATRVLKLVQYLEKQYPNQNWKQYLTENNQLNWDKIIVAGHSQGAGHACYLAKKYKVNRVVMFAGPNDFNTNLNKPANWFNIKGVTELNNHFALLHEKDEVIKFEYQVSNFRRLGLLSKNENPTSVEKSTSLFKKANVLSVNIKGLSAHNVVVGKNKSLSKIWTYLFTGK